MRRRSIAVILIALAFDSSAIAQYVVDHQPYALGGSGSDTELPSTSLPFTWQGSADDFQISLAATVTHVNWWGFHFENLAPPDETMRIRFYAPDPSNGLPGPVLYEETFINPERIDTGRTIAIVGRPHEYRYHAALAEQIKLDPGIVYWFEVVQVGDSTSGFRFEYSRTDISSFVFRNNLFPDWRYTTATSDLAFQLVVPEPVTASMLLLGIAFAAGLRARGRANPRSTAKNQ